MQKEYLVSNGFLWGPEHHPYGASGFMSYGPLGKALKSNIEGEFKTIFQKEGFEEIETPVLYPSQAWQASGHSENFPSEMFHTHSVDGRVLTGRTELATTIYPLFRKLLEYYKGRLPFRVFQSGIVLPNDRQTDWQIKTRQYTAHEGHIFFEAGKINVEETLEYLQSMSFDLMGAVAIPRTSLAFHEKKSSDKPFYATKAFGMSVTTGDYEGLEVLGIQYRGSRDFERHSEATGQNFTANGKYPQVIEISFSTERPFVITIEQALKNIESRLVLQLPEHIAPVKGVILPLRKTTQCIHVSAHIQDLLRQDGITFPVVPNGSIGKRYRDSDSIGVPYTITVDDQSVQDKTFSIRNRDSKHQVRVNISDLRAELKTNRNNQDRNLLGNLYRIGLAKIA